MPAKLIDRTGMIFKEWTVLSFIERRSAINFWMCQCSCGTKKPVAFGTLANGRSTSCGCKAIEKRVKKLKKHGMAGTPTYKSWHAMIQRTEGKGGHESYVHRKIDVCMRWLTFDLFFEDMGVRPIGTTLDRIDNNRGYYKENCRWATHTQQSNNTSANVYLNLFGKTMTVTEASRHYNIGISCLRHRLRKGMDPEMAVTLSVKNS